MMRKVVFFTDSSGFGGAEQVLLTILAGLDRGRWRPLLMHHQEPGLARLLQPARALNVELRVVPRLPDGARGAARVPRLIRDLRALQPDVFHANLTWSLSCKYGLVAAILARTPAVVAMEHLFVDAAWRRPTVLEQRLICQGVDRYVAVSYEVAERLHQTFHIPTRKLRVVHSSIAVDRFSRPPNVPLRIQLAQGSARRVVLTTARLHRQKGHCYLLQAAALLPEAVFVLAGDGPERPRLEAQARELELAERVVFLGHRDDVPELLAACDLLVLPSLFEGLGLALLEAMAAGKPVVASAVGGIDEVVIDGETGLLVPPADPVALADAIRRILLDTALASSLAAAGKARVSQQFSAETMVERVTQIYGEILDARGRNGYN